MDLKKVNKLIIDSFMSKDCKLAVGRTDELVGITTDGFCLFIIDRKDFIFDYDKLENIKAFNFMNVVKLECETELVELTGDVKVLTELKRKIVKVANENKYTFVNEKYLKYFSKNCKYRIDETKTLSPLYVFDEGNLVGVIMAYNLEKKKGEKKC